MSHTHQPLRIAIATSGRFHVLDLARELDALGHHVRFYSHVPRRRAHRFGLPARCHVNLFPLLAPFAALVHAARGTRLASRATSLLYRACDNLVALRLEPCDVFIGMSAIYLKAPLRARERFGARIVIERGSVHIEAQKAILDAVRAKDPKVPGVPTDDLARELRDYAIADRIVVPSRHAERSFVLHGIPPAKLFRNSYGVELSMFSPDPREPRDPKRILFVGAWSYQKGVDTLLEAMATLAPDGFRLTHVGVAGDAPAPDADWFEAAGSVDQTRLPAWYRRARCLVLPSRQDGFGMVLVQALACGCPVVGSSMTGAADLQEDLAAGSMVQVVPVGDAPALAEAIRASGDAGTRAGAGIGQWRAALGWDAYARRYDRMLAELMAGHPGP